MALGAREERLRTWQSCGYTDRFMPFAYPSSFRSWFWFTT